MPSNREVAIYYIVVLIGIQGSFQESCSIGDVRLVGGQSESDGRVEVCANGTWENICQQFFDARDARVICRQIGYDSETAVGVQPWPDPGTGPIYQLSFDCIGNESSIFNCTTHTQYPDVLSCNHYPEVVGVICDPQGVNCTDADIRLVDGPSEYEGRLEICYRGLWGTVCGDHVIEIDNVTVEVIPVFDSTAAEVVCKQLGHLYIGANIAFYGRGSGPIYLDDVNCTGEETALDECVHSNINEHQCSHLLDIGITCPGCLVGDIRIVGPSSTYGRVEVCVGGRWGTICENFWDARNARVACRQLGFESETAIGIHSYGGGTGPIHLNFVQCTGNETTLSQCPFCAECAERGPCRGHQYDAAVDCFPQGGECTAEDLRLVEGDTINSGRLEICHAGYWGTICGFNYLWSEDIWIYDFTQESASVACRQLGFSPDGAERYEAPIVDSGPIFLEEVRCQGDEERLSDCPHAPVNEFGSCYHWGDIALTCQEIPPPTIGTTADSTTSLEPGHGPTPGPAVIVGGVASILLFIIVAVVLFTVCILVRWRQHVKNTTAQSVMEDMELLRAQPQVNSNPGNTYLETAGLRLGPSRKESTISKDAAKFVEELNEHLLIPSDTVRLLDTLGQGEFGIVYKAHLIKPLAAPRPEKNGGRYRSTFRKESIISNPSDPLVVAVKTLKGYFGEMEIAEMIKESVKMQQFDHDNVLSLMGICIDAGPAPYIVMPFMANGSLISYLKKERASLILTVDADEDDICTVKKRLIDMCLQIAKGMEYLSSMKVIHRDMAARNCMIDTDWVIKVADFGLSESTVSKDYFRQDQGASVKLPIKWMAPESLSDGVFSEKTDVWSFGITCWEVFSGGKGPYPGIHPVDVISLLSENEKRLEKPANVSCCNLMYSVMHSCWEADPADRPTFSLLVQSLNRLLGSLSDYLDVSTFQEIPGNKNTLDVISEESCVENSVLFENKGTDI